MPICHRLSGLPGFFACLACLACVFCFLGLAAPAVCPVQAQTPGTTADPLVSKSYVDRVFRFQPTLAAAGQMMVFSSGCLFVVREGTARLVSGQGLVDLTLGREVPGGTVLASCHLYLVADANVVRVSAQSACRMAVAGLEPQAAATPAPVPMAVPAPAPAPTAVPAP